MTAFVSSSSLGTRQVYVQLLCRYKVSGFNSIIYITLQHSIPGHSIPLHYNIPLLFHCIPCHSIPIPLHFIPFHSITLQHSIPLPFYFSPFHSIPLHCVDTLFPYLGCIHCLDAFFVTFGCIHSTPILMCINNYVSTTEHRPSSVAN